MAVDIKAVEEVAAERESLAHGRDVEFAAEAAHGDLERLRHAVRAEGDGLAVEDQAVDRQPGDGLDDLGRRARHIVELAGEDADVAAGLVELYARAVELVLEAGLR